MTKHNIFEDQTTTDMPSYEERSARTSQDMTDTHKLAAPPGLQKVPFRGVENVIRPRRGHDY
jgi:hypothetical protein